MTATVKNVEIEKVQENLDLLHEAREELKVLQAQFEALNAPLLEVIAMLEKDIKTDVLEYGHSISGEKLTACWANGRTTWDSKKLAELAEKYPEINDCRRVGSPSVSFRSR